MLYSADELAARVNADCGKQVVTAARLLSLCASGHLPHVVVDGSDAPLFRLSEAKDWVTRNLLRNRAGVDLPIVHVHHPVAPLHEVPPAIAMMSGRLLGMTFPQLSGVYFLIRAGEVVYVGQSRDVAQRVATHCKRARGFDRALVLPVPEEDLDAIEGAFIRALSPPWNGQKGPPCSAEARVSADECVTRLLSEAAE